MSEAIAGTTVSLVVQANDVFGNQKQSDGDGFTVTLQAQQNASMLVLGTSTYDADGAYNVEYLGEQAGVYLVSIKMSDTTLGNNNAIVHIGNSPSVLTVSPNVVSAEHCEAVGAGTMIAEAGAIGTFDMVEKKKRADLATSLPLRGARPMWLR
jgi:hypothetical protein